MPTEPFFIALSEDAKRQLGLLSANDRKRITDAIENKLTLEPTAVTRNRKPLLQSSLADWELRVGEYRVFYRVKHATVDVVAIGKKDHNRLTIEGEEIEL